MPLKRRIDGDLIAYVEFGGKDNKILRTAICGSNNANTVISCLREVHNRNLIENRIFRLNATKIDENGDAEVEDWTFGSNYLFEAVIMERFFRSVAEKYEAKESRYAIIEDSTKLFARASHEFVTSINRISEKYPELNFQYEDYFSAVAMEKFPFHLFPLPRYMTNYKYE
ncbi:hypothetical protein HK098_000552 [Nowakowskiella sp. JEL0407]|nr:hypothetical protein HK098_000552 [Nowakowskiella sp. JEL0407]